MKKLYFISILVINVSISNGQKYLGNLDSLSRMNGFWYDDNGSRILFGSFFKGNPSGIWVEKDKLANSITKIYYFNEKTNEVEGLSCSDDSSFVMSYYKTNMDSIIEVVFPNGKSPKIVRTYLMPFGDKDKFIGFGEEREELLILERIYDRSDNLQEVYYYIKEQPSVLPFNNKIEIYTNGHLSKTILRSNIKGKVVEKIISY